jgi:hypothetical protein
MQGRRHLDRDHDLLDALRFRLAGGITASYEDAQEAALDGAVVRIRLLPEPCMWTWEICDPRGDVIDSGWASEWAAYDSAEEAYAAGRQRLTRKAASAGR